MIIRIKFSSLRESHCYEYVLRCVLGGLATVCTGAIAKHYGPCTGGLFLAFPAIFTASATIIEKHERQRKEKHGLLGAQRGKQAAALEACGTALGSFGMLAFAVAVCTLVGNNVWFAFSVAAVVWLVVSISMWSIRRSLRQILLIKRPTSTAWRSRQRGSA
jgi:hypothetical protein